MSSHVPGLGSETRAVDWRLWLTVFCLVLLAQGFLVSLIGTDIPFYDQWDVEGSWFYPAIRDGSLSFADFFRSHNEHRIVWTHVLNYGLFRINGQWDPMLQLTAGALLHAVIAGLLVAVLSAPLSKLRRWILASAVIVACLPLPGWHNAVWGFQSQVYFGILFSLVAFALADYEGRLGWRFFGSWSASLAAILSMGPGDLTPVALLLATLLQAAVTRRWRPSAWRIVAWLAQIALIAWLYHPVPEHAGLRAGSLGEFLSVWVNILAWPFFGQPIVAIVLNAPLIFVVIDRLRKRSQTGSLVNFAIVMGLWAIGVTLAAAWTRGGGDEFKVGLPSRYADFVVLLPLANVWCVLELSPTLIRWRSGARFVVVAWLLFLSVGWLGQSAQFVRGIVLPRARDVSAPIRLVREFQRTGDERVFAGQPRLLVPHPNLKSVKAVMEDPRMHGVLPPSLQPELPQGPLSRPVRLMLNRQ